MKYIIIIEYKYIQCNVCYAYNIKLVFLLKIFNVYVRHFIALWFHCEFLTNIEKKLKKINS